MTARQIIRFLTNTQANTSFKIYGDISNLDGLTIDLVEVNEKIEHIQERLLATSGDVYERYEIVLMKTLMEKQIIKEKWHVTKTKRRNEWMQ